MESPVLVSFLRLQYQKVTVISAIRKEVNFEFAVTLGTQT